MVIKMLYQKFKAYLGIEELAPYLALHLAARRLTMLTVQTEAKVQTQMMVLTCMGLHCGWGWSYRC